jgi:hypothetical protein
MASTKADFSQRDPRWSGQLLGFARWQTMGGYGCYVTAYANVAQAHGHNVTPADVNQMLRDKNLFVMDGVKERSDIARPDALSILFPGTRFVEQKVWGNKLADITYFDVRHTTKTEIIVMIDMRPEKAGVQTHFCRVIGINAAKNDVEIVDSIDGKRKWVSSYGKPANKLIYKAVKFQKV